MTLLVVAALALAFLCGLLAGRLLLSRKPRPLRVGEIAHVSNAPREAPAETQKAPRFAVERFRDAGSEAATVAVGEGSPSRDAVAEALARFAADGWARGVAEMRDAVSTKTGLPREVGEFIADSAVRSLSR